MGAINDSALPFRRNEFQVTSFVNPKVVIYSYRRNTEINATMINGRCTDATFLFGFCNIPVARQFHILSTAIRVIEPEKKEHCTFTEQGIA